MILKTYKIHEDIPKGIINEINKFDVEGISNLVIDPFTFDSGIVLINNLPVGLGILRVISELKVVLKPELSNFNKAKILNKLINKGVELCPTNEILVEITQGGDHYISLLEKHFDFYENHGIVLRKDI